MEEDFKNELRYNGEHGWGEHIERRAGGDGGGVRVPQVGFSWQIIL